MDLMDLMGLIGLRDLRGLMDRSKGINLLIEI